MKEKKKYNFFKVHMQIYLKNKIVFSRSDFMVTIYEDLDKQWKIMTETCVKAKSMRGYKTKSFKMTSNKFRLNEAKPELLEDWDPR